MARQPIDARPGGKPDKPLTACPLPRIGGSAAAAQGTHLFEIVTTERASSSARRLTVFDVKNHTRWLLGARFASSGRRARRALGARVRRSFCRVLPLALLSMLAPPAIAHYAPGDCNDGFGSSFNVTTGEYEWFDAKDPCKGGHQSGDPVDTYSGSFVHGVVDLSIPGRGLDVEIRRSYRSTGQMNGPFGYNWSFNYN